MNVLYYHEQFPDQSYPSYYHCNIVLAIMNKTTKIQKNILFISIFARDPDGVSFRLGVICTTSL
jgi:hypothetical protein